MRGWKGQVADNLWSTRPCPVFCLKCPVGLYGNQCTLRGAVSNWSKDTQPERGGQNLRSAAFHSSLMSLSPMVSPETASLLGTSQ